MPCRVYIYDVPDCSKLPFAINVATSEQSYQCFHNGTTIKAAGISAEGTCKSGNAYVSFCSNGGGSSCKTIATSRNSGCIRSPISNAQYIKFFCLQGLYTSIAGGCTSKIFA